MPVGDGELNNEELFSVAIDQEWAAFNEQLAIETADGYDTQQVQLNAELEEISDTLLRQVDEGNILRLIFQRDNEAEYAAAHSYLRPLYERCLKELFYVSEVAPDITINRDRYVQKALACVITYINEKKFQESVITYAAAIEYVYRHQVDLNSSNEELGQMKKSMHAKLLVRHGRHMNDAMVIFFQDSRPEIEGLLSESRPVDSLYLSSARQDLPKYIQIQNDQASILETAIDLVTYKRGPELWDDASRMATLLTNIADLYMIAAEPFDPDDGADLAKRNERLWKYRQNTPVEIGNEQYNELVDYFDGNYEWNMSDE